jgi:ubiquinone/menaquinone biosynthesis C-methylase UbiE
MLDGVIPSPNIWNAPAIYEVENRGVDPDGVMDQAIRQIRGWDGARVLDIGCGSGYHLPRFATTATKVVGVEPHPPLVALARRRCRDLPNVDVRVGTAQHLPIPDASVDLAHARWAYFFGPGC